MNFVLFEDENGIVQSNEYRIGVPVKFIVGDMHIELDSTTANAQDDDIYCLYANGGKRKFKPLNPNTTLVSNFSELEEIFTTVIKKAQVRK